jgi:amidophosphoribosyltransferase
MAELVGNGGIGHNRYPTAGSSTTAEAQPFYTNTPYGICLAHNGNLTNAHELLEELTAAGRHINTSSDSEVLLNIFAEGLLSRSKRLDEVAPDDIFHAVEVVQARCRGGFSAVVLINGIGMVAFRDCNGIRPCVIGTRADGEHGMDYMIASESVAIEALGFTCQRT